MEIVESTQLQLAQFLYEKHGKLSAALLMQKLKVHFSKANRILEIINQRNATKDSLSDVVE